MKPNPSKCTKHTTESHRKYLLIPMVSFVLFCSVPGAPIAIAMHSPARNGEERADTWVPSERTVRSECGNMQASRSEWEYQQRMDERRHARLPEGGTHKGFFLSARTPTLREEPPKMTTHHPTRSRTPSTSQAFFPSKKRANSGAARWCTTAKPTVEMRKVCRWSGRRSKIEAIDAFVFRSASLINLHTGKRRPAYVM